MRFFLYMYLRLFCMYIDMAFSCIKKYFFCWRTKTRTLVALSLGRPWHQKNYSIMKRSRQTWHQSNNRMNFFLNILFRSCTRKMSWFFANTYSTSHNLFKVILICALYIKYNIVFFLNGEKEDIYIYIYI
jgi:hypothetical protein